MGLGGSLDRIVAHKQETRVQDSVQARIFSPNTFQNINTL